MFIKKLKELNINYSAEQLQQLKIYFELLKVWNEKINLTTIISESEVYNKHFFDSLLLSKKITLKDQTICDVGTGAGFPGIVLKIFFPKLKLFLVEAVTKKCVFLKELVDVLQLKEVLIIDERVENISVKYREFFDIVTARAVAKLNVLLELCIPILKLEGYFIALKAEVNDELKDSLVACKKLKTKLVYNYVSEWEFLGKRTILYFKKLDVTSRKYPRNYSKIKKLPLK